MRTLILAALLLGSAASAVGGDALHRTAGYFDLWFKRCDAKTLENLLAPDVTIVNAGGATSSRADELRFYADRCREPGYGTAAFPMRWEALPGTFEEHRVEKFGVIETGQLRFLRREQGGERELVRSRYLASWEQSGTGWRLKHLFLYGDKKPTAK